MVKTGIRYRFIFGSMLSVCKGRFIFLNSWRWKAVGMTCSRSESISRCSCQGMPTVKPRVPEALSTSSVFLQIQRTPSWTLEFLSAVAWSISPRLLFCIYFASAELPFETVRPISQNSPFYTVCDRLCHIFLPTCLSHRKILNMCYHQDMSVGLRRRVCLLPFNLWTNSLIFTKFGIIIVSSQAIPSSYIFISYNQQ